MDEPSKLKQLISKLVTDPTRGTQTSHAKALGVSVQTVNKWAKGHNVPDPSKWAAIERHFELAPGSLVEIAGFADVDDSLAARVTLLEIQVRAMAVQLERLGVELDADDGLPGDAIGDDRVTDGGFQ